ncbi:kelch-like protein 10 [Paramacrobiotus metropolitanus]|uniref:kelch-like protein 10 n=1 Tax=Paramacrobiotus metropolitanus TaxID=2943436 RepID=UPI0024459698|nr:kelch-like protein 10 [Paramacrobiotus metropolitanus]
MSLLGQRRYDVSQKISSEALELLNDMRKIGQLCDAELLLHDGSLKVHRAILSSCSPYFRALFTTTLRPASAASGDHWVTRIHGITREFMEVLIDYAYTRKANINVDNVQDAVVAADMFCMLGLLNACVDFMRDHIDPENSIQVQRFADAIGIPELKFYALRYLLENFAEIRKTGSFSQLSLEELVALLRHDMLNVSREEQAWEAIVQWIEADRDSRKRCIVHILPALRCGLIDSQYFMEKIKSNPLLKEFDNECKPVIIAALKYIYDLDLNKNPEQDPNDVYITRSRAPHEIMFAMGGWSGGSPTNLVEVYDVRADRWIRTNIGDRNGPRAYHGLATMNGLIYTVGGFDGISYFNTCRAFDPVTRTWLEISPMQTRRCYVSVISAKNHLYAMGGYDGESRQARQATVERYSPRKNQWRFVAPMNSQRSDGSACVMDDKIYMVGGFNGQECLQSAEIYDPAADTWEFIQPMRNRRSGVGACALNGCIFAIGGFNGVARMLSGEKYSPVTNQWTAIKDMLNPRSNYAIQLLDGKVFAVGGFNGVTTIVNVECYDEKSNEWQECASMSLFRSALSACVIGNIPNIGSFIERPGIDEYVPRSLQVVPLKEEDSLMVIEAPRETTTTGAEPTLATVPDVDSDVDMEDII